MATTEEHRTAAFDTLAKLAEKGENDSIRLSAARSILEHTDPNSN